MSAELSCSLHTHAEALVLMLRGELDLASVATFEQAAADALATRCELLVIDLRELGFMDSSGLRAFLRLQAKVGDSVRLEFLPGPHRVQRVFELAGLTAVLPFRVAPPEPAA
jgi:anti-anti-sigma factor